MKNKLYIIMALTGLIASSALAQSLALLTPTDVSASVNISVTVAKKASLELLESRNTIEISTSDLERGYVDLPRALALQLWCNSSDGALVETELTGGIYDSENRRFPRGLLMYKLSDQNEYQSFEAKPQALYQSRKIERGSFLAVDLRLLISKEMTPGEYSYQASFTASPI
ncbi:MAG: hypothetical protein Q8O74_09390 [bacterium]|nr:hypothetical protein [bacterium]